MNRLKNLYHTTCRNRILEEKTTGKRVKLQMWTRKMERERYCELIWCSNVIWFLRWSLIQNHFPHKMHKRRIDLFVCLGMVYHHYKQFFYRFDRNVIKPSGRAWFRCSVRGCSAKWANYKKNITNKHTNLSGWPRRTWARRARITRSPSLIWRQFLR